MDTPRLQFLEARSPLAGQVAEVLWGCAAGAPRDLGGTQVWVPTAGAARRIRFALAELASRSGSGVLPPVFLQPMQALLPSAATVRLATRAEREAAWAQQLRETPAEGRDALFPRAEVLQGAHGLLTAAGLLCDLCDLLAEAGLDPGTPEIAQACHEDPDRWAQLAQLYAGYVRRLGRVCADPNVLRIGQLREPSIPAGLERLVIACVPDLPRAAARFAAVLAARGIEVRVLVWKPGELGGGFDAWGRPLPEEWERCDLPLALDQITVAGSPEREASALLDYLGEAQPEGDYALVLADPALAPVLGPEILRRGCRPFQPEGEPLAATEAATVALGWMEWVTGRSLRVLRRLLEAPHFAGWVEAGTGLGQGLSLAACDQLIAELLVETADQAVAYLDSEAGADGDRSQRIARLLGFLESHRTASVPEVLGGAWADGGEGTEAARSARALWEEIAGSPLFENWAEGVGVAFARALQNSSLFAASRPGDVELSGWLEAPWSGASRLAVAGFVEGCVPASVTEHLFLPDSRRSVLGLTDNAARRARDAYLLNCLARARDRAEFRCSFSKFAADGGPGLPSGLLLRCPDAELPVRVRALFAPVEGSGTQPRRANGWRWHLPEALRKRGVARVSPTDFKQYLACPFRFYFQRVLHLEEFDPRVREMDALRFGSLIHRALEFFAKESPGEAQEERIERIVIERMEAEARRWFGPSPSPAVRVQLEAVRLRLRAFARLQADAFAEGWRIVDAERKLAADEPDPLRVGGLAVSAQIDRIDRHPERGIRIIDYKTFATAKTPEQTHLGGAAANTFLPEAHVQVGDREICWVDLQLPLYRVIGARWYPGSPVEAAYLVLPADPEGTAMAPFEIDDRLQASAMACAEAVARRVGAGVFWPPQPPAPNHEDPFAPLFLNGSPEQSFTPETIAFLQGDA